MSNSIEHIDQQFADIATNGKVSVPNHLQDAIFSQLATDGFSKPASKTVPEDNTTSTTAPFLTKTLIAVFLITITAGIFIGWQLSRVYYTNESLPQDSGTIPTSATMITPESGIKESAPTTIDTEPLNQTENIRSTIDEAPASETITIDRKKSIVPNTSNSTPIETNSVTPTIITTDTRDTEEKHLKEEDLVNSKTNNIEEEVTTNTPIEVEKSTPEEPQKSLLDQLKDQESRFNDNLFKE